MAIRVRRNDASGSEEYLQRGVSWQWVGVTLVGLAFAFLLGASEKVWNLGTNVPTRAEIADDVEKHDRLDDQRFKAAEGRLDTIERIQRERLDQINTVKDLTIAVERHVLLLEKDLEVSRSESKMRIEMLERLLKEHMKEK